MDLRETDVRMWSGSGHSPAAKSWEHDL